MEGRYRLCNDKDIENLSRHLKTLRQVMKWTQDDLAKRVGVSRQTITLIESGKSAPSKTLVLAILGIFIVLIASRTTTRTSVG
ncbi:helix-turn-helix transcriptional regulator [Paenibacillus cymbidii]|uniref:helix-turn-helix transcriptional regulator n=1 Tax=Paenibacillus cymbidii TaxID=1639034 RepID=UPI0022A8A1DB|nr:helix-turn-helix domain-containing protein [Paenibacillus cymbidii]